jgi:hypothetical protein
MGTHGVALFHDDVANDVREDFLHLLIHGHSADDATKTVLKQWSTSEADADDGPVLWLALAATQWEYGQLQDEVRQRAVHVIDTGADLGRWSGSLLDRRRKVLGELRAKLLSPQPKPKRPRKLKQVEPPPSHEAMAPDGRGKAVAFNLTGADFMQVYVERQVDGSRGGGSVFSAHCRFDEVDLVWLPGPKLCVIYPRSAKVRQQDQVNFFRGETIPIDYQTKE